MLDLLDAFIAGWQYHQKNLPIQLYVLVPMMIQYHSERKLISLKDLAKNNLEDERLRSLEPRKQGQNLIINGEFSETSGGYSKIKPSDASIGTILSLFSTAGEDIWSANDGAPKVAWQGAIARVYSQELQILYGGVRQGRAQMPSVILEYPDLIAQAGRLSRDVTPQT